MASGETSALLWKDAVVSVLEGSGSSSRDDEVPLKVKKLRKMVLLSLQLDEVDKTCKKQFKRAVQALEGDGVLTLDADGHVALTRKGKKKRKAKEEKGSKRKKKNRKDESAGKVQVGQNGQAVTESEEFRPQHAPTTQTSADSEIQAEVDGSRNKPCKGNPQGITRLFVGNLPFAVEDHSLKDFLPGVTHIKWITDKETGKFYGSAFVEMGDSTAASEAVSKAGSPLMGRPIKINYCPARPGDVWPPSKKVVSGGGGGQAGGSGIKAMSVKPENCTKLFIGNLSYDIDDDGIKAFFASVDSEVKAVRWLHHKDGFFKGCGYVEFWNTEACEKAAALNGKNLLGRPIRIDWTD